MALTDRDIKLFARDAVFADAHSDQSKCVHAKAAVTFFDRAQQDIRNSGYRVTQRIKDALLSELLKIQDGACCAA